MADSYAVDELHQRLDEFEADLRRAGLAELSVRTYVDRSRMFLRWLDGTYTPQGPRT